jgi:hypothetical protein
MEESDLFTLPHALRVQGVFFLCLYGLRWYAMGTRSAEAFALLDLLHVLLALALARLAFRLSRATGRLSRAQAGALLAFCAWSAITWWMQTARDTPLPRAAMLALSPWAMLPRLFFGWRGWPARALAGFVALWYFAWLSETLARWIYDRPAQDKTLVPFRKWTLTLWSGALFAGASVFHLFAWFGEPQAAGSMSLALPLFLGTFFTSIAAFRVKGSNRLDFRRPMLPRTLALFARLLAGYCVVLFVVGFLSLVVSKTVAKKEDGQYVYRSTGAAATQAEHDGQQRRGMLVWSAGLLLFTLGLFGASLDRLQRMGDARRPHAVALGGPG